MLIYYYGYGKIKKNSSTNYRDRIGDFAYFDFHRIVSMCPIIPPRKCHLEAYKSDYIYEYISVHNNGVELCLIQIKEKNMERVYKNKK